MDTEQMVPGDAGPEAKAPGVRRIRLQPRRRTRSEKRKESQILTPHRLALWVGLPVVMWGCIYTLIALAD